MFSITINGNTPEELFRNLQTAAGSAHSMNPAQPAPAAPVAQFPVQGADPAAQMPAAPFPPAAPISSPYGAAPQTTPPTGAVPGAPVAATAPPPPAQPPTAPPAAPTANPLPPAAPPMAQPPAAAPTYTIDALAKAGAALAQSGKMNEALALLARYGVQTVNQLKPEHYGAFATELRALGAQV